MSQVKYAVSFKDEFGSKSGSLIIDLSRIPEYAGKSGIAVEKLERAAKWALDIDVQYRDLVRSGRSPEIIVPAAPRAVGGRVARETVASYQKLRLGIGGLIRPALLPQPSLKGLFPFQYHGVKWLVERREALLADDMGLGKTIQVISAMRVLFSHAKLRTSLIVCPKSLIANWERELGRWAPELGVAVLTPPARIREDAWKVMAGRCHVLLTNYEQLREPPDVLIRNPPDLIVADEAHRLRNSGSRVTSGSLQLKSDRFWMVTGTPLERDLEDLATLLSLIAPGRFSPTDANLHPSSLHSRAAPYVLRRQKEEILQELPTVLDTTEVLELSRDQERAYRSTIKEYRRGHESGGELALLTRLQALCDLEPVTRQSCKVERTLQLLGRIREYREKAVIFSHRLDPLRELQRRIIECWGSEALVLLTGEVDGRERERAVTYFRNNDRVLALLASSRIGGEGLTLVEANHVFLFNQWWNPSANDQARDRVVRIGQKRNVRVYRFCCYGTIEEHMERILASKRKLFGDAVDRLAQEDSMTWAGALREVGLDRLLDGMEG